MALAPGIILAGRYRILRWLAEGGFGTVYLAEDTQNRGRQVAIKESLERSPRAEAQFTREAALLAKVDHPGLPHVIDYFSLPEQGQYLVMDYIAGSDLRGMLAGTGGRLPEAQAMAWILQVCDAVSYLHSLQPPIIHRDIKPANIKITPDGNAVLVDFGIAKVFDAGMATATSARAVSPGYSPIEQYAGSGTDERSDIYALGATLYHLLTGSVPPESVQRRPTQPLAAPAALSRSLSPHISQAILTATAVFAEERFASVESLTATLRQAGAPAPSPVMGDLPTMNVGAAGLGLRLRTSDLLRRPKTWVWGGAATTLLLGGWWLIWQMVLPGVASTPLPETPDLAPAALAAFTAQSPVPTASASPASPPAATDLPTPSSTPAPTPTLSPFGGQHGQWIAFVSMRDGQRQLYLMKSDGSQLTKLTSSKANDNTPAWAPDGAQLAFASDRDGAWDIFSINADGTSLVNLTRNSGNDETPAWSPDGQQIAFGSDRDGDYDVYVMRTDGSEMRQITNAPDYDGFPAWSPDGQWLAFQSHRDGFWTLYVIRADGTQEFRLVDPTIGGLTPAWSPDGTQIGFASFRDGPTKLYSLNFADAIQGNTTIDRLSTNSLDDQSPGWAPDGQYIVLTSKRTGDYEIYVLTLADQTVKRLTLSNGHDQYPAWQP
jgi:Tol biopolymer transport system component